MSSSNSPGDGSILDPDYLPAIPRMEDFGSSDVYEETQSEFIEPSNVTKTHSTHTYSVGSFGSGFHSTDLLKLTAKAKLKLDKYQ